VVAWLLMSTNASAQDVPVCEQDLPAATSGTLRMDSATVAAGGPALALVSGLDRWPTELIGGGSGETFLSCTPWAPQGAAEVMADEDAAVLLVPVPAGTAPGSYPVSVVYVDPDAAEPVRLRTTVTVAPDPVAPSRGVVCELDGPDAAAGELTGDDSIPSGATGTFALDDVGADRLTVLNEYDRLWFVACLDGIATPVVSDDPGVPFTVAAPAALEPGAHRLRLLGLLDSTLVVWQRGIVVGPDAPTVGTVVVERADCTAVVASGSGWLRNLATIELAVPPSEGGESVADVVAGPLQVIPGAAGELAGTELRWSRPPADGRYAVVALVDGIVRTQSAGFELTGCARQLSLSG
jgi:hypothetical protein